MISELVLSGRPFKLALSSFPQQPLTFLEILYIWAKASHVSFELCLGFGWGKQSKGNGNGLLCLCSSHTPPLFNACVGGMKKNLQFPSLAKAFISFSNAEAETARKTDCIVCWDFMLGFAFFSKKQITKYCLGRKQLTKSILS